MSSGCWHSSFSPLKFAHVLLMLCSGGRKRFQNRDLGVESLPARPPTPGGQGWGQGWNSGPARTPKYMTFSWLFQLRASILDSG